MLGFIFVSSQRFVFLRFLYSATILDFWPFSPRRTNIKLLLYFLYAEAHWQSGDHNRAFLQTQGLSRLFQQPRTPSDPPFFACFTCQKMFFVIPLFRFRVVFLYADREVSSPRIKPEAMVFAFEGGGGLDKNVKCHLRWLRPLILNLFLATDRNVKVIPSGWGYCFRSIAETLKES